MTAHPNLPHLSDRLFLTDSGFETTLIFHDGIELPHFAAIALMRDKVGRHRLVTYLERHIDIARRTGLGYVIEGPTWRASTDWGDKLGLSRKELTALNRDSVALQTEIKARHAWGNMPMAISGTIGPRGDGYAPGQVMSAGTAQSYHMRQIETLAEAGAEIITAFTITSDTEAIGIARAAIAIDKPAVISFTLETDGRLPTGQSLRDAITSVDDATAGGAAYYMINCAHPDHFTHALPPEESWTLRVRGIRANASRRSHRELDEASELDDGNPEELGAQYRELLRDHPGIAVVGGCCGTDHRHVSCIAEALRAPT